MQASLHTILPSGVSYWIGLADFADEGIYRWQTGYDIAEYTFWFSDQPDAYDSEDCVELVRATKLARNLALVRFFLLTINIFIICTSTSIPFCLNLYCSLLRAGSGTIGSALPNMVLTEKTYMLFVKQLMYIH